MIRVTIPKGGVIMLMLIYFFISCGTHTHRLAAVIPNIEIAILPIVPDTPKIVLHHNPEDKVLVKQILKTPVYNKNTDTLVKLNIGWQAIAARAIERAYENRLQKDTAQRKKDSTMAILRQIQQEQKNQSDQAKKANDLAIEKSVTNEGISLEVRVELGFIILNTILISWFRFKDTRRKLKVSTL